eukprot:11651001-Prorocentrum_lima.AAC.1
MTSSLVGSEMCIRDRLVVVANAAYKSNEGMSECLALPGYLILLLGSQKSESYYPGGHSVAT